MNNHWNRSICRAAVCVVCFSLFFAMGCATSKWTKFQSKIQKMSDNELSNYYHGINARLNAINSDSDIKESKDPTELDRVSNNKSFVIGGEGYDLHQKKKLILKEMRIRGLNPG